MYNEYKIARDMSWEILIKSGINSLPINLNQILKTIDTTVCLYSDSDLDLDSPKLKDSDGFATLIEYKKSIYLNDQKGTLQRRRFTLCHELGHVVLNHPLEPIVYRNSEIDDNQSPIEIQANIFARDLLMPAGVLAALHVTTVGEIIQICNVSRLSAEIRLKRLQELYKRNMFGAHPLERKMIHQFSDFINSNK